MIRIMLSGARLTKDPEQISRNGKNFVTMGLACDEGYGDNKTTQFFNAIIFGAIGESCLKNLSKGNRIEFILGNYTEKEYKSGGETKLAKNIRVQDISYALPEKKASAKNEEPVYDNDDEDGLPF